MHILKLWQKCELNNLAAHRQFLNSVTDADRIQKLNDTLADLKDEWATEIVKDVFNRDDSLDDDTRWQLEEKVSAAIEGYYQWACAMVIYHAATDDRYKPAI